MVSEFMLQQTPVSRVLPAHAAWLERWPTPAALAAATPAAALRQWDRLGYPRRAVRLHASAELITTEYGGAVPQSAEVLRRLPGVGSYTAAAIASFAFGRREVVLDTNVRRVLARLVTGNDLPPPTQSAAERQLAEDLLPRDGNRAAQWSVGVMELGALVCTTSSPRCDDCPLSAQCAWLGLGRPAGSRRRATVAYHGSDRQCRGRLLRVLRNAPGPVRLAELEQAWDDARQRERTMAALISDGLVTADSGGWFGLPGDEQPVSRLLVAGSNGLE
jgi:A/G-specific adenine glycosylase